MVIFLIIKRLKVRVLWCWLLVGKQLKKSWNFIFQQNWFLVIKFKQLRSFKIVTVLYRISYHLPATFSSCWKFTQFHNSENSISNHQFAPISYCQPSTLSFLPFYFFIHVPTPIPRLQFNSTHHDIFSLTIPSYRRLLSSIPQPHFVHQYTLSHSPMNHHCVFSQLNLTTFSTPQSKANLLSPPFLLILSQTTATFFQSSNLTQPTTRLFSRSCQDQPIYPPPPHTSKNNSLLFSSLLTTNWPWNCLETRWRRWGSRWW